MKKQLIKGLLLTTLVLGTAAPLADQVVFAEGPGSITVESTNAGAKYQAFKIFDATYSGDATSYTIPEGLEATYKGTGNFDQLFSTTTNGGKTYVTKKESASDTDIAAWTKAVVTAANIQPSDTQTAAGATATLAVPYGYYYVGTDVNGGATTMVTSASPQATVREKNNEPSWGENGGKTVGDDKTYAVGETVTYTLDYQNATYYTAGEKVYQYVVKDALPTGVDFSEGTVKVTVNGVALTQGTGTGTYAITEGTNGFEVTIPWAATNTASDAAGLGEKDDFFYDPISTIKVTYQGVLLKDATEGSDKYDTNKNLATINPNTKTNDPGKEEYVYNGKITIDKVAANSDTKLQGAKFVLRQKGSENYLNLAAGTENVTFGSRNNATEFTTDQNGAVSISGLDAGDYELIETQAPEGYNLLDSPVSVTLGLGKADGEDNLLVTSKVENNSGAELPSTGGIGTTIFYTVGTILIVAGGVVLIARRRARD